MPRDRNAFQLGLMVIVVLALFATAVVYIGGGSFEEREPIVVRIAHDLKVPRIKPGAPIICGPQQVGTVSLVKLVEAPSQKEPEILDFLYFEIHGQVNKSLALRSDCRIVVEGPLLGDNGQLTIENRGTSAERLSADQPVYARIAGFASELALITGEFDERDSNSLLSRIKRQLDPQWPASVVSKVHKSLDDLNAMSKNLSESVDPTRQGALIVKIDSILDHLNTLTATLSAQMEPGQEQAMMTKLHRGLDQFDRALTSIVATIEENRPGIRESVASIERATGDFDRQVMPAITAELERSDPKSLLARVHAAFDEIDSSLADIVVTAGKTRNIATLSEHRIVQLISNVKEASDHLKAVSKDLRRNPWRLIHKPEEAESKQAYVLDAVREFAEASAHLDDTMTQLEALSNSTGLGGSDQGDALLEIHDALQTTMKRFTEAEEALWAQLDVPP